MIYRQLCLFQFTIVERADAYATGPVRKLYRYPEQIGQLGTPCSTCPSSCHRFIARCNYAITAGRGSSSRQARRERPGIRVSPLWSGTVCASSLRKYKGDPDKSSQQWLRHSATLPSLADSVLLYSLRLRLRIYCAFNLQRDICREHESSFGHRLHRL